MDREIDFINSCTEFPNKRFVRAIICVWRVLVYTQLSNNAWIEGVNLLTRELHSRIGFYSPSESKQFWRNEVKIAFYHSVYNVCHEFRNTPFYTIIILYDPLIEQASIVTVLNLSWHSDFLKVCTAKYIAWSLKKDKVWIAIKYRGNLICKNKITWISADDVTSLTPDKQMTLTVQYILEKSIFRSYVIATLYSHVVTRANALFWFTTI